MATSCTSKRSSRCRRAMLTETAGLQILLYFASEPSDPRGGAGWPRFGFSDRSSSPAVTIPVVADAGPWPSTPIRREEHPWRTSLVGVSALESSIEQPGPDVEESAESMDLFSCDVLVVGGGGAGL